MSTRLTIIYRGTPHIRRNNITSRGLVLSIHIFFSLTHLPYYKCAESSIRSRIAFLKDGSVATKQLSTALDTKGSAMNDLDPSKCALHQQRISFLEHNIVLSKDTEGDYTSFYHSSLLQTFKYRGGLHWSQTVIETAVLIYFFFVFLMFSASCMTSACRFMGPLIPSRKST